MTTNGKDRNRRAGPVFKYGLAAGFALILLGGFSLSLALTNTFLEMLVVCAGLGVILGAFGSTASVSIPIQGITLGGVAAIVVALFIVLLAQLDDRYVLVKIGGPLKDADVQLVGDDNYLGAYREELRTHEFIILGKEIKLKKLKLFITLPNQIEIPFECIDSKVLRPHLATGKTIEWSVRLPTNEEENPSIYDMESGKVVAENSGGCGIQSNRKLDVITLDETSQFATLFGIISTAFAQSDITSLDLEIQAQTERLESGTSYVRRGARSALAAQGIRVIEPLLKRLSKEPLSYRLRLGMIVALTEMMRENKQHRTEIIKLIKLADLERLADAAGDNDRTIRIYASEFLYDLGDPRVIPLAFDRFQSASMNGRYNILLVIKGAVPFASDDEQAYVISKITALKSAKTPKINTLIDSIVHLAKAN